MFDVGALERLIRAPIDAPLRMPGMPGRFTYDRHACRPRRGSYLAERDRRLTPSCPASRGDEHVCRIELGLGGDPGFLHECSQGLAEAVARLL